LPGSNVEGLLTAIANQTENNLLDETVVYERCRVHGDLHLGNIMLGTTDVLIDFASSMVGPVAVDLAKFVSDLLLRLQEIREAKLPRWDTKKPPMSEILMPLQYSLQFGEGDIKVFQLFLSLFMAQALNYDDVPDDAKHWARSVLASERF
jgi:thiamine kinase-like enzyme